MGNICRSPLAQGILQHHADAAGLQWEIDSAGTGDWHVGSVPHPLSCQVAREFGIDLTGQRGRQFVPGDLQRFDRIYFMDRDNYREAQRMAGRWWVAAKCELLLNELYPGENRGVPDPYGQKESRFREVYHLLDTACSRIIERYRAG